MTGNLESSPERDASSLPAVVVRSECPECGAPLTWSPKHQSLSCTYCGTVMPSTSTGDPADPRAALGGDGSGAGTVAVLEQDLLKALQNPASGRDWGSGRREVQCDSCKAISIFVDGKVAQNCEFCGSPSIIAHESRDDAITPQSVLPFRLEESQVRDRIRAWYGNRWFAPNRLRTAAFTDQLHGLYLPYWTFDARVAAQWTAEAGHFYQESEQVRTADGRIETRQVRKVRWEPAAGSLEHFFDDELIPGTEGVHAALLRRIEPFPTTTGLKPYAPDFVRGWTVERYQIDLRQAQARNLDSMENQVRSLASQQVPGQTQRNLRVATQYADRTFKHVLVPVWLITYRFGGRSYQILANGHTGEVAGERPYSWIKIAFALLLALLVLIVFGAMQGG